MYQKQIPIILLSLLLLTTTQKYNQTILLQTQQNSILDITLTPNSQTLAYIISNGNIKIYKYKSSKYIFYQQITPSNQFSKSISISDDGNFIVVGRNHVGNFKVNVEVYRIDSNFYYQLAWSKMIADLAILDVDFCGDGGAFGVSGEGELVYVYLFGGVQFDVLKEISVPGALEVQTIDLSFNGDILVFGTKNSQLYYYQYDGSQYQPIQSYQQTNYNPYQKNIAISQDGSLVAYQSDAGYLSIYEYNKLGQNLLNSILIGQIIKGIDFTEDNNRLVMNFYDLTSPYTDKIIVYMRNGNEFILQKDIIFPDGSWSQGIAINKNASTIISASRTLLQIFYECSDLCILCNNGTCESCKKGSTLLNGICQCQSPYTYNPSQQQCTSTSCNGTCGLCNAYGDCLSCFYRCNSCTSYDLCVQCAGGFYLSNNSCYACSLNISQCSSITCQEGQYVTDAYLCETCNPRCTNCSSELTCFSCKQGYYQSSNTICNDCHSQCQTCNNSSCQKCFDSYFLQNFVNGGHECLSCPQKCLVCQNLTFCVSCVDGYYGSADMLCDGCHSECAVCHNMSCSQCRSSFYLEISNDGKHYCKQCSQNCLSCDYLTNCSLCTSSFYLNIGINQTQCSSCPSNCLECSSTQCTKCSTNYLIKANSCQTQCQNICKTCSIHYNNCSSCFDGFYLTSSICSSCLLACKTCQNSQQRCTSCSQGFYLNIVDHSCVGCDVDGCAECFSVGVCTRCLDNYEFSGDGCIVRVKKVMKQGESGESEVIGPIAGVLVCIVAIVTTIIIYRKCKQERLLHQRPYIDPHPHRARAEESHQQIRPQPILIAPAPQSIIRQTCCICLQDQINIKLFCSHKYHVQCILQWITRNQNCPYCRTDVRMESLVDLICRDCGEIFQGSNIGEMRRVGKRNGQVRCGRCRAG